VSAARWLVLSLGGVPAEHAGVAAEALLALGGGALEERAGRLISWLPAPAAAEAAVAQARTALLEALPAGTPLELEWSWQQDQDWAAEWKRGLAPRELTPRLVVTPTWTEWQARPGQVVIEVDPQMAFGTGEHATTRGCLRLLDGALRPGDRVLDVGSGSAILAIAAVRLGAREAVAVEYDPDANLNARENLVHNRVDGQVRLIEAMADPAFLAGQGRFDLVLANILSGVIRPLLPALHAALGGAGEGRLIVSGILREEAEEVTAAARQAGFRVAQVDAEDEWWSALLLPE
jgi:ribosomal protein L11 methyltransferase